LPEPAYCTAGDPNCLSVLLDNLVVNAIKYNKPGGKVTVTAELTPDEVIVSDMRNYLHTNEVKLR
jgi:signal transduction histidine kinase